MKTLSDYQKEYNNNLYEIKLKYSVDYVVNYDQLALYSAFKRNGLDFHSFKCLGERTYINGNIKVLAIDFDFYHKHIKQNPFLTGYNKTSLPSYRDKDEFYDNKLNLILPFDEEQHKQLRDNWEQEQQEKKEWSAFEAIKPALSSSKLGTQFEVGETIYWHFLECLPPIYGKGCFYCSEPIKHNAEGKPVYHCLRKNNGKFTIEENILIK